MKKGTLVIISTVLVVIGLILLVSSLSLTGNVISEKIGKTTGSILGLVFVIGGILLFQVGRERTSRESRLVGLINERVSKEDREKTKVLLDSSFLKYIYDKKIKMSSNFFGNYDAVISPKVYAEIIRHSQKTRAPLIPRSYLNGFLKEYNVRIDESIQPKKQYIDDMVELWKQVAPKDRINDPFKIQQFRNYADAEQLAHAYIRDKNPTIILTENYIDIGKVADALRKKVGVNVRVYRPREVLSGVA